MQHDAASTRATAWTVDGVLRDGIPVMLRTDRCNAVARALLEQRLVPGLEQAEVVACEVKHGASRFDFLLQHEGRSLWLEVKSCTLLGGPVAMFPDAVTQRGARHVRELTEMSRSGTAAGVLFLVHHPAPRFFAPDLHADLDFARAFLESRGHLLHLPLALEWSADLALSRPPRLLDIPWDVLEREVADRGSYVIVLRLDEDRDLEFGRGLSHRFRAGWYAYVGSAMRGLSSRVARHLRLRKKHHWHVDALRAVAQVTGHVMVRSSERLECTLADALGAVADFPVEGFGASDFGCSSHLLGFETDPLQRSAVHDVLAQFRAARLIPEGDHGPTEFS